MLNVIIDIVDQHTVTIERQDSVFRDHPALRIEIALITGFYYVICLSDPILSVLNCFQTCIDVVEVVVITIDKTGKCCHTAIIEIYNISGAEAAGDMRQAAIQPIQTRLNDQCTIIVKKIIVGALTAIAPWHLTKSDKSITVITEEIALAIYGPPFSCNRLSCPVISATGADCDPVAPHQYVVIKSVAQILGILLAVFGDHRAYCLHTVNRLECNRIKVIILAVTACRFDLTPAVFRFAVDRIVERILISKQAGDLACGNAVCSEIKPVLAGFTINIAGKLLNTGQSCAVLPIGPFSAFFDPSVFGVLLNFEVVCKISDGVKEVCAVVTLKILTVVIGIQTVLDLILFLLSQRFQHMEMRIDVITESAADCAVEQPIFIPCSIIRRNQSKAAEYTKRVRGSRIDRLALLNEIADDRQLVAFHFSGSKREVFIGKPEFGCIDRNAVRSSQRDRNCRQRTDTLGKLQKKIPCRASLLVTARKHVQECCELIRNWHFGHIHSESIRHFRCLACVDQIVSIFATTEYRVRHLALPGK